MKVLTAYIIIIIPISGKLKYGHCGKGHLNGHKSRKRLRRLAQKVSVEVMI
ncbi:50S ribosomal protein L35 [archaeon]|nr:MAG: 50S ribosomal protein L35 [archaeon]